MFLEKRKFLNRMLTVSGLPSYLSCLAHIQRIVNPTSMFFSNIKCDKAYGLSWYWTNGNSLLYPRDHIIHLDKPLWFYLLIWGHASSWSSLDTTSNTYIGSPCPLKSKSTLKVHPAKEAFVSWCPQWDFIRAKILPLPNSVCSLIFCRWESQEHPLIYILV